MRKKGIRNFKLFWKWCDTMYIIILLDFIHCLSFFFSTTEFWNLYSVWLWTGWPGFNPLQGQRIFPLTSESRLALGPTQPPIQWIPVFLSLGVKHGQGVTLTTHPHLVPRSRISRSYTSSPPKHLASMACSGTTLLYKIWKLVLVSSSGDLQEDKALLHCAPCFKIKKEHLDDD
jgi:hypothetical protein